jgi:hypothetical protein
MHNIQVMRKSEEGLKMIISTKLWANVEGSKIERPCILLFKNFENILNFIGLVCQK